MNPFSPPEAVRTILEDRYYQEGEDWEALCKRVSHFAAQAESEENRSEWEGKFFELLRSGKALPNTPALAGAGVSGRRTSVAACFHFRPDDTLDSIMECRRLAGKTLQYGGGVGFELSNLRPAGSPVRSAHRASCGVVATIKDYNGLGIFVTQGGLRPAALMAMLSISHPEIIKFISCKSEDKDLANFNISVSVPDSFMRKLSKEPDRPHTCHFGGRQYNLLEDGTWLLRAERGSKKVLSVGDVWRLICENASLNGDPGVFFVDTANRDNPLIEGLGDTSNPYYFWGTNPCLSGDTTLWTDKGYIKIGELFQRQKEESFQRIGPGGEKPIQIIYKGKKDVVKVTTDVSGVSIVCTPDHLFSVMAKTGPLSYKRTSWEEARNLEGKFVEAAVFNGGAAKVTSVKPAGKEDVYDFQVIGETDYEKQCGFANDITVHNCSELPLPNHGCCVLASVDLAKFVEDKRLKKEELYSTFRTVVRILDNFIEVSDWPDESVEKTIKETRQIGSGVMGFTSLLDKLSIKYGSEECFSLIDEIGELKKRACEDESKALAEERGVYPAAREGEIYRNSTKHTIAPTGSLAMIAGTSWSIEPHLYWAFTERRGGKETGRFRFLPAVEELLEKDVLEELAEQANGNLEVLNGLVQQKLPSHMTLSKDLSAEDHIRVVAAWQRWTDSSISKTIVLPGSSLTSEKVSRVFKLAWESKLKGLTVYPEGSRAGEPMSVARQQKKLIKLPDELDAKTVKVKFDVAGHTKKAFIHVGFHPDNKNKPVQVFLTHPYEQDETFIQFISMMTRLVSLCLRYRECPHCKEEALPIGQIIRQLSETDGQNMFSVPKMLVEVLSKYLDDGEPVGTCPNCRGTLTLTGRCFSCTACGWSRCG